MSLYYISEGWKEHLIKNREEIVSLKNYGVDEDKRAKPEEKESQGWGLTGSFRKMNVD